MYSAFKVFWCFLILCERPPPPPSHTQTHTHTKSHISPSSSLLAQPVLVHFHQLSLNPTNKIISAHMLIFLWETRYQPSTPILPSLSSSAAEMKLLVSASVSVRALGINRCRKNLDTHTMQHNDIYPWLIFMDDNIRHVLKTENNKNMEKDTTS